MMMEGQALQVGADGYGEVIAPELAVRLRPDLSLFGGGVLFSGAGVCEVGAGGHGEGMAVLEHSFWDGDFSIEEVF